MPFHADFFLGTFLPFARASESPIAIACFLLLTVLPLPPLLSVPALRRFMARLTSLDADLEYRATVFPPFGSGKRRFTRRSSGDDISFWSARGHRRSRQSNRSILAAISSWISRDGWRRPRPARLPCFPHVARNLFAIDGVRKCKRPIFPRVTPDAKKPSPPRRAADLIWTHPQVWRRAQKPLPQPAADSGVATCSSGLRSAATA